MTSAFDGRSGRFPQPGVIPRRSHATGALRFPSTVTLGDPTAKRLREPPPGHSLTRPQQHSTPLSADAFGSEPAEYPAGPDRYELAERRVGNVLDNKWKLEALLGVGGMAAVYAATHRNGARAAIKFLPFSLATGPEVCQRLLREGYLANKIHHSAVVRVLDDHIDYEKEYAYIVMELLEGETTRQRLERTGSFAPLQAIELMLELCDCLRAAHQAQVIHRDIKPENLFLTKQGLKVLDFGIARALDGNSSLTQTGTSLGTPAYMSPEQARGKQREVTARSDIYAVGATLLFLLSGETMHQGDSPMELMVRAAWTPPPRARKLCPSLPEPLAEVIDRCCAFDPNDRYPDAEAVISALESVYRRMSSAPPPFFNPIQLAPPDTTRNLRSPAARDHLAETIDAASLSPKTTPGKRVLRSVAWIAAPVLLLVGAWGLLKPETQSPTAAANLEATSVPPPMPVAASVSAPRDPKQGLVTSVPPSVEVPKPTAQLSVSKPKGLAHPNPKRETRVQGAPEPGTAPTTTPTPPAKKSIHIDIDYSNVGSP